MIKKITTAFCFSFILGNLFAQQLGEAPFLLLPEQNTPLKELSGLTISAKLAPCSRQAIIDDYNNTYVPTSVNNADLAWTGSEVTCMPGTTSAISKTRTIDRINYFRKLVGKL